MSSLQDAANSEIRQNNKDLRTEVAQHATAPRDLSARNVAWHNSGYMKRLATVAALLLISTGCENAKSHLDTVKAAPTAEKPAAAPSAPADHSGDVEARLRRLEDTYAKNAEALDFLNKVYAQQKQQQQQQEAQDPDPTAVFAVNIADNVKLGMVEGPSGAAVTIVEAWDFA